MIRSAGTLAPASLAKVGSMSIVLPNSAVAEAAATTRPPGNSRNAHMAFVLLATFCAAQRAHGRAGPVLLIVAALEAG